MKCCKNGSANIWRDHFPRKALRHRRHNRGPRRHSALPDRPAPGLRGTAARQRIGGAAGGLALGKLGGSGLIGTGLDMAGSIGGDILASRVGEEVMKYRYY